MKNLIYSLFFIGFLSCHKPHENLSNSNELYKIETEYKTYYTAGEPFNNTIHRTVYFIEKGTNHEITLTGDYTIIKLKK